MSPTTKKELTEIFRKKYRKLSKKEKSKLLDEFCELTKYDRKYAIKILKKLKNTQKKKAGKKVIYDEKVVEVIKNIWLTTDQICSKRLVEAIPVWLPFYEQEYGGIEQDTKEKILTISHSSIDRKLSTVKAKYKRKGLSGTKPGTILKTHIPIKTEQWDTNKPGFVEADTVAHCGSSLSGDFIWSLTFTDIYSGWTENRAVWGKGALNVLNAIKDIENSINFTILGFDCDNGSEFLNWHLIRYFLDDERKQQVQFTRSRPYHKNDNAHVEQKNWTHVRQLLGYERLENPTLVALINDLYKNTWTLFQNYFLPSTKLIEKHRYNSKIIKKHRKPSTPYQNLLNSPFVSNKLKNKLTLTYNELNPFHLKREIDRKLEAIFKQVSVSSIVRQ
jgi:hypothetical protein